MYFLNHWHPLHSLNSWCHPKDSVSTGCTFVEQVGRCLGVLSSSHHFRDDGQWVGQIREFVQGYVVSQLQPSLGPPLVTPKRHIEGMEPHIAKLSAEFEDPLLFAVPILAEIVRLWPQVEGQWNTYVLKRDCCVIRVQEPCWRFHGLVVVVVVGRNFFNKPFPIAPMWYQG